MAIQQETIPNYNIQTILSHLEKHPTVSQTPLPMGVFLVHGSNKGETSLCQFHAKTYSVTIDNIKKRNLISNAKWTGAILLGIGREYEIEELTISEENKVVSQNKSTSHLGKKIMDAVNVAQELPETQEHDYEIKLLTIPSLHVFILWLHPDEDFRKDVEDLFIPITDSYGRLEINQCYRQELLLNILNIEAQKMANKWNKNYV
ncbi:MAG: hypothetical protein QNJ37_15435 [Crocosphaera sp.]|nr:hypothetical protein [Crocosphaera sp.]